MFGNVTNNNHLKTRTLKLKDHLKLKINSLNRSGKLFLNIHNLKNELNKSENLQDLKFLCRTKILRNMYVNVRNIS